MLSKHQLLSVGCIAGEEVDAAVGAQYYRLMCIRMARRRHDEHVFGLRQAEAGRERPPRSLREIDQGGIEPRRPMLW